MNSYQRRKAEIAELEKRNTQLFKQLDTLQSRVRDAIRATGMMVQDPISGDNEMGGNEEKYVPIVADDPVALCNIIRELGD